MNPDFSNLSGLNVQRGSNWAEEIAQEDQAPITLSEQLNELYEEIANMLNNEYSSIDAIEVRWFCGERKKSITSESADRYKALKQIIKKISETPRAKSIKKEP